MLDLTALCSDLLLSSGKKQNIPSLRNVTFSAAQKLRQGGRGRTLYDFVAIGS